MSRRGAGSSALTPDNSEVQTIVTNVGYRCPTCRSIDWFRDGCLITEDEATGKLMITRVQVSDPRTARAGWSCTYCAYELLPETRLARALDIREQRECG